MVKIEFPRQLDNLLAGSELLAPARAFADKAGEILADNKLPFFPDYTDHGIEHVNRVLKTEVELVPKGVWEKSKEDSDPRLLCDVDAAIIIGATILHDIAMHIYPEGFKELIRKDSRFKPLKWFDQNHENYTADIQWFELWENYTREARRFSERQLSNIIGEKSASVWKFDKLPEDPGLWELNHRLVIGEFIRRHHARLAHEIAMYGFPGLSTGFGDKQFPAIGEDAQSSFKRIADLIGLTARSHGISLRVCKDYLDYKYPKLPRPAGSAVLYPMVLLRIADYFQIDQARAPAVLLQLRDPQSPVSLQEWQKHQAVESIDPANDPRGRMVTVSNDIPLPLYLQLKELLESLQTEIDQSTAVLDEMYGVYSNLGLDQLNLAVRRIHSNLQTPAFIENLNYVPVKSGFSTDPNLLSLLVEPLYGNHPGVGVRELMQNAVDAVCELDAWCKKHDKKTEELDLPDLGCDVLIEFEKMDDGRWILRVQDRGIGMTSDTIQNYFLRAGASFRHSAEWMQEFLDDDGKPRVARAGRFGIGAFAVFLLGSSFKLWTRHVSADEEAGFASSATATSQLIEIRKKTNLPIGTKVEVELSKNSICAFALENESNFNSLYIEKTEQVYKTPYERIDWFCWDWPKVSLKIKNKKQEIFVNNEFNCPVRKNILPPSWSVIHPEGFDAVYWTFENAPILSCNGLTILKSKDEDDLLVSDWTDSLGLEHPCVAVIDSCGILPLSIQRNGLLEKTLPFRGELERDVILSYIAFTLICGPVSQMEALSTFDNFPLHDNDFPSRLMRIEKKKIESFKGQPYRWYVIPEGIVLSDQWLYTLLGSRHCIVFGVISDVLCRYGYSDFETTLAKNLTEQLLKKSTLEFDHTLISLFGNLGSHFQDWSLFTIFIHNMVMEGIIGSEKVSESHLLVARSNGGLFEYYSCLEGSKRLSSEPFTTTFQSELPLREYFESLEVCLIPHDVDTPKVIKMKESKTTALFVAELKIKTAETPQSTLAKIWNECLGPRYIPFDPVARAELIEHGRKHPELKRHIEAWEEMKRTGSKWATGEWRGNESV